jgi:predicted  nucleic acid-binding Zn-ribbon protein
MQETNAVLAGAHRELAESENQIMALQARVLSLREELADSKLRFDEQVAMTEDEMARREAELGELSP